MAAACLTIAWISVSWVSTACRFLRTTRRVAVSAGCACTGWWVSGWGGGPARAGAGRGGLGVDLRNPAPPGPHARGTAGWGAHCRSASSFFSSSSICRGRSRAVRHALLGSGRALATGRQQGGTGRWAARRDRRGVPRVRAAETRRVACAGESGWRAGHCCGECRSIARHTEHVGRERDRARVGALRQESGFCAPD